MTMTTRHSTTITAPIAIPTSLVQLHECIAVSVATPVINIKKSDCNKLHEQQRTLYLPLIIGTLRSSLYS